MTGLLLVLGLTAMTGPGPDRSVWDNPAMAPAIPLHRGMVITKSARIRRGVYALPASPSLDSAVIIVRGDNITIDFDGAEMRGTALSADPDEARGVGIRVEGGHNVRILNAHVRGYKVGLLARGTRTLDLIDNDFSYNWKPRLYSLIEHESLADWLSHHHNEKDEWLRFGAGVYLSQVHGGEIRGNRIVQGMEGLMMERTDSLLVWNNTIEFNSGVGIGMYRSSYNRIMHNYASYNVRGFSRYYRRGQDSADLLMYEQSSHNLVAYNSMTHGGDGLFLWAGQTTMDTGEGGANDNLFYANDFSYAPANAIEATFSRNTFVANNASGSDYGLWGGYSFDSKIAENVFVNNRNGIAIEHGQNNEIRNNQFWTHEQAGISLWGDPIEPSEWGYPKHRETASKGYVISDNRFTHNRVGIRLARTSDVTVQGNRFAGVDTVIVRRDSTPIIIGANDTSDAHATVEVPRIETPLLSYNTLTRPLNGGFDPDKERFATSDRNSIKVDEWGPYSYSYPLLWPVDSTHANPIKLTVLGPPGEWRLASGKGVASTSLTGGRVSDTLVITPAPAQTNDWSITLEYRAADAIIDARGRRYAPRTPYRFTYSHFEPIEKWDVAFHIWNDSTDPRTTGAAFKALLNAVPLMRRTEARLDYMWYGPAIKGLPQSKWAAVATTQVTLSPGEYTIRSISDDGARVYVDGKLVIDDWTPHESAVSNAPIAGGRHDIRVEYYQIDGWTELRVEIVKGKQKSSGSPGPH